MLGVDRLDMIKGIPQKLVAFEKFLEDSPKWRDKVVLVQIAVPSRADVPECEWGDRGCAGSPPHTTSHQIALHCVAWHPVPSRPVPSRPVPSRPVPSLPIPSHPTLCPPHRELGVSVVTIMSFLSFEAGGPPVVSGDGLLRQIVRSSLLLPLPPLPYSPSPPCTRHSTTISPSFSLANVLTLSLLRCTLSSTILLPLPFSCLPPSPADQQLTSQVHEIVGRINGRFGTLTTVPIHHLVGSVLGG